MRRERFVGSFDWGDIWMHLLLCCLFRTGTLYNLDSENPVLVKGPAGTLFGYSVLLHSYRDEKWCVVGAPKANTSFGDTVSPGIIYKCRIDHNANQTCEELHLGIPEGKSCGPDCKEEKDNQWLGVSLSRQPKKEGYILACAHRWKNVYYQASDKRPLGLCFKIPTDLQPSQDLPLIPCFRECRWNDNEKGRCQAGIASFLTEELIIMGAPGSRFWTGTVAVKNEKTDSLLFYKDDENIVQYGSYLGYAVSAGHFTSPNSTEIVGGAPQQELTGQVYIFEQHEQTLKIIFTAKGKMLGSYFGSSVCAVDLNSDGLSDLLVGAPMYSIIREEGRVYVYLNTGLGVMKELAMELVGRNSYAARFGEAIVDLGDINDDGHADIAIGAPQEEDQQGAIYIYNGNEEGILSIFSQRIHGLRINNALRAFGQSISGGIDIDNNGYSDVAVGAFMSDTVVLLRSRPVVVLDAFLQLPPSINRTKMECFENGKPVVCINVSVCFSNKGKKIPGHIVLRYNISTDVKRRNGFPSRFILISDGNLTTSSGQIALYHNIIKCNAHQALMRREVRDILTPVYFEVSYFLEKHITKNESTDAFRPLQPVLQKKGNQTNEVKNKTYFERYCAFENCSANLQVSGKLLLTGSQVNKSYLAVQEAEKVVLNVLLFNAGDDAYSTTLTVKFPKDLHFIKIVEVVEKHVMCNIVSDENSTSLECIIGHLYLDFLSKVELNVFLDASSFTRAEEDIVITVNATCENEESLELLEDNFITLNMPLKYEVNVALHGSVYPPSFLYEGVTDDDTMTFTFNDPPCTYQNVNYSFQVTNMGNSIAPGLELQITQPNTLRTNDFKLFEILDVKTDKGECRFEHYVANCAEMQNVTIFHQVFNFFKKLGRKVLSCFRHGISCLSITCQLGDIEHGRAVSIHVAMRLNYAFLASDSAASTIFTTEAVASSGQNPKVIEKGGGTSITVIMEAIYNTKPKFKVAVLTFGLSLLLGILILATFIFMLCKCGFFKRSLKTKLNKEMRKTNLEEIWMPISQEENDDNLIDETLACKSILRKT
ncbi:integrin alpha-4 isoform X1 [Chiloscyllium plagiosum]|uniref:integrin alpha-4 isoform X1 n=1 Tax=Chiloscyllium plagiosum TaxID=36176 RepID=UPI001CB80C9D|nr:integrin alpha-4 isoform X1 [Chiloscyllium plagiosum]XP_043549413.1 integrin alpha-4 isoform X1 [Chiloscyllium plagiosum]